MKRKYLVLALMAPWLLSMAVACGGADDVDPESRQPPLGGLQGGADQPLLLITQPESGSLAAPGDVTVRVSLGNLGSDAGKLDAADGRLIYYKDVKDVDALPGTPKRDGAIETTETSHTWRNVSAGSHIFAVQLVRADGTAFDPPIIASTVVNLR